MRGFIGIERRKWVFATLALAPVVAIFAAVRLYPIAETLRLSLFQWNILSRNKPFVGLQNFIELTSDPRVAGLEFRSSLRFVLDPKSLTWQRD